MILDDRWDDLRHRYAFGLEVRDLEEQTFPECTCADTGRGSLLDRAQHALRPSSTSAPVSAGDLVDAEGEESAIVDRVDEDEGDSLVGFVSRGWPLPTRGFARARRWRWR